MTLSAEEDVKRPVTPSEQPTWLDRPVFNELPRLTVERLLVSLILIVTIFSRFYILGERVMSHDEVNHVVPAYDLYQGRGYAHDPVTHGPMQFHLLALSYFLFGDSDFSARIPAALFSIATVACVLFLFRPYLGRAGALLAGLFFMISPYMLFYGRYTRNEAFVGLFGVLTIYAVLHYLEKGKHSTLYLLTTVTALHFCTKETSFIYTAILMMFLLLLVVRDLLHLAQNLPEDTRRTILNALMLLLFALLMVVLAVGLAAYDARIRKIDPQTVTRAYEIGAVLAVLVAAGAGGAALVLLIRSLSWKALSALRSFEMLLLVTTLVLPQLTAFPIKMVGSLLGLDWNPLDYGAAGLVRTSIFLLALVLIAIGIGYTWNLRLWLGNAAVFYAIFTVLYTTFFTNGKGFFTGIVGALGYWLSQQGEFRGSQPWYFYALIQMPIYEFLAVLGLILAVYYALRHNKFATLPGDSPARAPQQSDAPLQDVDETMPEVYRATMMAYQPQRQPIPTMALLLFWSVLSLVAYSLAGEKMPWLTVHITLPMLLAAGWGVGYLVDTTPWRRLLARNGVLVALLTPVFLLSFAGLLGSLLGDQPPFAGNEIVQLNATSNFLFAALMLAASSGGLVALTRDWSAKDILRVVTVFFFGVVTVLTARAAFMASYINYDTAKEYLVYAHAARGPKDVLAQVEEISRRTTRGKDIIVAYDNAALYPYWWYFRDYPNKRWFSDKPTRDLQEAAVIIVGETNVAAVEPLVRDDYIMFQYMRLWWPNQDYFNLTWQRLWQDISDPKRRAAIFDIWLNRDYKRYAALTGSQTLTLENWDPADRMRMYVRKDIAAQIWEYGAQPVQNVPEPDPYAEQMFNYAPDLVVGQPGDAVQFNAPRGIAVAPDGTLYVADSRNHRVLHLDAQGGLLQVWGSFAETTQAGAAPAGTFNEPWGIAVGLDGSVYVADTWNHRIQHFTADGMFINMWGTFGQASSSSAFWGPRGVAIDEAGRVLVTDTGNKRVLVFSPNGDYITQFGEVGMKLGAFDEPVGLAVAPSGLVFVADTWNHRVQTFSAGGNGLYLPVMEWPVKGWEGQSLENKPFLALGKDSTVFVTDPENYRVLQFQPDGKFLRGWGQYSTLPDGFGLPSGVAVDGDGRVWVTDAANNLLLRFSLPQQ